MTPDFWAGLFIGSVLVYACWLLSLRLAEPPDDHLYRLMTDSEGNPATGFVMCDCGDVQSIDYDDMAGKIERVSGSRDPIGDALVLLDKAFSDE